MGGDRLTEREIRKVYVRWFSFSLSFLAQSLLARGVTTHLPYFRFKTLSFADDDALHVLLYLNRRFLQNTGVILISRRTTLTTS
jgi:hypothetical protein